MRALRDPMTVLRATAWPVGADEPYGPIVRAIGPMLRAAAALGELAERARPCDGRGPPPDAGPLAALAEVGARPRARGLTAPERRQARTLEGILGLLGRLGEQHPVVLVLEDLHLADAATRALVTFLARISRDQRLAIIGTHQPDVVARDDPWKADLTAILTGPRSPIVQPIAPLDRDELAALIEGIEGERASASLLLLVAERSGGLPLVAEELLAARRELPSASLTGSFDELVIARLAVRSQECRRVLRLIALARRPLTVGPAGRRRGGVRRRHEPRRTALGDRPAPGRGRPRRRPVGGPGRGARQRLPRRDRRIGRLPTRFDRSGGRPRSPADRPDPASRRARRQPRRAAGRRRGHALAGGSRAGRGKDRSDRRGGLRRRPSRPADELAALELALSIPAAPPSGPGRRRATAASDRVDLQVRAADAAFAVGRMSRATAFLESAIGGLDGRRDRVRLGLLHERLAHIRRAAGDPAGAMLAARRAVELVPARAEPGARDGPGRRSPSSRCSTGSSPRRSAWRATRSRSPGRATRSRGARRSMPRRRSASRWPGGATRPPPSSSCEAERAARELDDPDALFRIRANLTTVLDLVSRRTEAVEVAYEGIEDARRAGLEAVYGNFLAGNVADTLFLLGRWPEARALSERAMRWLPVGVVYLAGVLQLAIVEIETDAGEEASRLLGQTILEFDAVREPQLAGPYYLAAASFALWRGDIADASRSVDRGWASVRATEEWLLVARMASMVAQVDAAAAAEAREHRKLAPLAAARERTAEVVATAARLVAAGGASTTAGSRQVAEASLATARAYQRRLEGDDDAAIWGRVAAIGPKLEAPYDVALARWRQAEAMLGGGRGQTGRADAQEPLLEAVAHGLRLGATAPAGAARAGRPGADRPARRRSTWRSMPPVRSPVAAVGPV